MEQSPSTVPLPKSTGKEIVTQAEHISVANLKPSDTDKALYLKVYRKWTPTNKNGRPMLLCCILIDEQV